MAYQKWKIETLEKFCTDVFRALGFTEKESTIIADVLLTSDIYGIESHGLQRMMRYHKSIGKGMIQLGAKPEVVFETPVSAVIDGHEAMGQLTGHMAMQMAIEKAKTAGIAFVTVRNSNHYGIAGYYAQMASRQGMLGFSCTNSAAIMVPLYGSKAMLGSNPLAVAMPSKPYDFFFDASTTVVTRGKLEVYNKLGKPLKEGWALDRDGVPTIDAQDVLKNITSKAGGGIVPLGGVSEDSGAHKGYGYGVLCEIFSAILSQGDTSNHTMTGGKGNICHGFAAVNLDIFGRREEIEAHLSNYLQELRDSPKASGYSRIYTHGEKEVEAVADRRANGVPVIDNTMLELWQLSQELGLDFGAYFGDYRPPVDDNGFKGNPF